MASRSRGWCFTLNNPLDDEIKLIKEIECRYVIYEPEIGQSGTPHLQGYVEFDQIKRLSALKKILERAHWEARRGTPQEASQYCKKEGKQVERGELPKQGKRSDLTEIAERVRDGVSLAEIAEEKPALYAMFHRGLEALQYIQRKDRTESPTVTWLWGKTGSGKTRQATKANSFYIKDSTKWWDGYDQQEVIVIDDFDGSWPFRDLLRLLDRYPYQGQTKGGYVKINSPHIYITCDKPPENFWFGGEFEQIRRRISVVTEVLSQKWGVILFPHFKR